ncbi:MAG: hypothetical protein Q7R57_04905 [Dehalococcoidales bacterium]|nr:hypothetical protein [Dehalococcoidales bacterium]
MKYLREIFDDWITRSAGIVFVLIVVLTVFNVNPALANNHPLLGALIFSLVPVLFIAGGVIFVLAILRS